MITLTTPTLSGSNSHLNKYVKIFYRLDNDEKIYEYTNPISGSPNIIKYWCSIGTVNDNTQLQVYEKVINKFNPTITWGAISPIFYPAPITSIQLNPSSNVDGTFTFNPTDNTILPIGTHALSATFIPTDTMYYNTIPYTNSITVLDTPIDWIDITSDSYWGSTFAFNGNWIPFNSSTELYAIPSIYYNNARNAVTMSKLKITYTTPFGLPALRIKNNVGTVLQEIVDYVSGTTVNVVPLAEVYYIQLHTNSPTITKIEFVQ